MGEFIIKSTSNIVLVTNSFKHNDMKLDASVHYLITRLVFAFHLTVITQSVDIDRARDEKPLMGAC